MKLFSRDKAPRFEPRLIATLDFTRVSRFTGGTARRILATSFKERKGLDPEALLIMALAECSTVVEFSKLQDDLYLARSLQFPSVMVDGQAFKRACLSVGEFRDPHWHDLVRVNAVVNRQILELYYRGTRRLIQIRKVYETGFQCSTVRGIRSFRWEHVEQVDYLSGADALRESLLEIYFDGYQLSMREK